MIGSVPAYAREPPTAFSAATSAWSTATGHRPRIEPRHSARSPAAKIRAVRRAQLVVHQHAARHLEPGPARELDRRRDPGGDQEDVGAQAAAVGEDRRAVLERGRLGLEQHLDPEVRPGSRAAARPPARRAAAAAATGCARARSCAARACASRRRPRGRAARRPPPPRPRRPPAGRTRGCRARPTPFAARRCPDRRSRGSPARTPPSRWRGSAGRTAAARRCRAAPRRPRGRSPARAC